MCRAWARPPVRLPRRSGEATAAPADPPFVT
jgi:hypothetical protein